MRTVYTIIIFAFHLVIYGQDCLEYPEIEGSPCFSCTPEEWSPIYSPDIVSESGIWGSGSCDLLWSGPSPGGGTASLFVAGGAGIGEGMFTTVSGLTPGAEYGFGLYWQTITTNTCFTAMEGELTLELDGEEYVFNGANDWEFIDFCFTASSSSVEILLYNSADVFSVVVVDSPFCEAVTPCCHLMLEVEPEYSLCPGESIILQADYFEEQGNVEVTWTCEPITGLQYLDDPTIINPSFDFPFDSDYSSESYVFTVVVEDDRCSQSEEIEVIVNSSIAPDFDIYLCEIFDEDVFPLLSDDGYFGVWTGDFDFEDLVGTTQDYTFNIDPGQDNCIEQWVYPITIHEAIPLTFYIETQYCEYDDFTYSLPNRSEDNVEGEWIPSGFTPSALGVGNYIFVFNADEEEYCAHPYELEIEVFEAEPLNFELPSAFCSMNDTIFLPDTSLQGIYGQWNMSFIDLNESLSNNTIVFTPDNMETCYQKYSYSYSVTESIKSSFPFPDTICRTTNFIEFETTSIEGYNGLWNPASVLFDTILIDSFKITWTPHADQSNCLSDTSFYIHLTDGILPIFNLEDSLCRDFGIYPLPTISNNNISGSWDISEVNTLQVQDSEINLIFTPDNSSCAQIFSWQIHINENVTPEFDNSNVFCKNDSPFDLPQESTNNISGTWSVNAINPSQIVDSIQIQFFPDVNSFSCAQIFDQTIYITETITPQFDLPEILCSSNGNYIFPTQSLNGINGSWDLPFYDPEVHTGNTEFENTFTPEDLSCHLPITISINSFDASAFIFETSPTSSCESNDGTINVLNSNIEFLISIDNGVNWEEQTEFNDLPSGDYNVLIADISLSCMYEFSTSIENPGNAMILEIQKQDVSNCTIPDGKIICIATGSDLEYSIDNGMQWQSNNTFEQLLPGDYTIITRSNGSSLCADTSQITIQEFPFTTIIDYVISDESDCNSNDGSIIIVAQGQMLEYSIDDGLNWQNDSTFNGLNGGLYEIIVRSQDAPDCVDNIGLELQSPIYPNINDIVIQNSSDCITNDGLIEIIASGMDLEYSIDNGANWVQEPLFDKLSPDSYSILVRESNHPNCLEVLEVELVEPPCPCNNITVSYETETVNCLDPSSGSITITNIEGLFTNEPYSIVWENGLIGVYIDQIAEGWHSYEIQYDRNCNYQDSIYIDSYQPISFDLLSYDVDCKEQGVIEVTNFMGGAGQQQYSIDGINFQQNAVFTNLSAQEYQIIVEDLFDCRGVDYVIINDNSDLQLDIPTVEAIQLGESTFLNPLINEATLDDFEWTPAEGILNPRELIAEVSPTQTTTYTLTIYFGDCLETRAVTVEVIDDEDIYIANIFNPNANDSNNKLIIQSSNNNIDIQIFRIYDRWGNLVFIHENFKANDEAFAWDGSFNNKDCEQGVYTYWVNAIFNSRKISKAGTITLIR